MRLLVLGGTRFIGRCVVETALAAGHEVTTFNRGRTAPELFGTTVDKRFGDRETGDLAALSAGEWDAVIDVSGFLPGEIRAAARVLGDRAGHYTLISSIAVYAHKDRPGMTEDAPLREWHDGDSEEFSMDAYGALKVGCERAATAAYPGATLIRTGAVTGPGDDDDEVVGWALAMAHDDELPCGARPDQPVQLIDVRDLAAFIVQASVARKSGVFNVVGPAEPLDFAGMLDAFRVAGGGHATVRWGADVGGFIVQPPDGSEDGLFRLRIDRALAAGLVLRPFVETGRDLIAFADRRRTELLPAWLLDFRAARLGTPVRGECLRDWGASQVWRVAYPSGAAIVKRGTRELADEADVYAGLVAVTGAPAPEMLAARRDGEAVVFALSDVGRETLEQRPTAAGFEAAARLLARLRSAPREEVAAGAFRPDLADLPVRVRQGLAVARPELAGALAELTAVAPEVLARLRREVPEALVHGDFYPKNLVHARGAGEPPELIPVDWSQAHLAPHLGDLYCLCREVRRHFATVPGLDPDRLVAAYAAEAGEPEGEALRFAVDAGGLMWALGALRWIVEEGERSLPVSLTWIDELVAEARALAARLAG